MKSRAARTVAFGNLPDGLTIDRNDHPQWPPEHHLQPPAPPPALRAASAFRPPVAVERRAISYAAFAISTRTALLNGGFHLSVRCPAVHLHRSRFIARRVPLEHVGRVVLSKLP